jgi:hypothetical protein
MESGLIEITRKSNSCFVRRFSLLSLTLILAILANPAPAFSLLGPYADWMQPTNGFRDPGDIGGPMDITEGYRWNVPVVTYGFDQSFVDFFGSNGVAAVESAIQMLNDLPPASQLVLTNYGFFTERGNWRAYYLSLFDLKSATLSLLLEHLGLAQPTRHMFVVRRWAPFLLDNPFEAWEWPPGVIPYYIVIRNFDPVTLNSSQFLNGMLYYGEYWQNDNRAGVWPLPVDADADMFTAVAEGRTEDWPIGRYYTGLTYDDVGGLRFLLSRTNVNYESLLSDIRPANNGQTHQVLVNRAWRPGVEKITFVRHRYDANTGHAVPMTIRFTDEYITNGVSMFQKVERVIAQPDFLFSAGDDSRQSEFVWLYSRTGTTNWMNNAAMNGNPTAGGPGVIQPHIKITFQKLGPLVQTYEPIGVGTWFLSWAWGSFDGSTNLPVTYPFGTEASSQGMNVRFNLYPVRGDSIWPILSYAWHVPTPPGGSAVLQSSTNLLDWTSVAVVTNNGTVVEWRHDAGAVPGRFFRALPE